MLARIPGDELRGRHDGPHAGDLVCRDCRSDSCAIDRDAGVGLAAGDRASDRSRHVGIIDWIGRVGSEILHRQAAPPKKRDERPPQRDPGVIARDRHGSDVGARRERRLVGRGAPLVDDGHAFVLQRIVRERRDVAAARQHHGVAARQHARVGFRDDVEPFHGYDVAAFARAAAARAPSYDRSATD